MAPTARPSENKRYSKRSLRLGKYRARAISANIRALIPIRAGHDTCLCCRQHLAPAMKKQFFRPTTALVAACFILVGPSVAATAVGAIPSVVQQSVAPSKGQKLIPSQPAEVEIAPVHRGKIAVSTLQASLAGAQTGRGAGVASAGIAVAGTANIDEATAPNIGTMILAALVLMLWIAGRRIGR
jgi:hypothetical protein